jgi:hypothetical protein
MNFIEYCLHRTFYEFKKQQTEPKLMGYLTGGVAFIFGFFLMINVYSALFVIGFNPIAYFWLVVLCYVVIFYIITSYLERSLEQGYRLIKSKSYDRFLILYIILSIAFFFLSAMLRVMINN